MLRRKIGEKIPYCPKCGVEVSEEDKFCSSCGARLTSAKKKEVQEGDSEGWSKEKKTKTRDRVLGIIGFIVVSMFVLAAIVYIIGPQGPKEVAESYSKNWINSSPEEAYELLSSSAKNEIDYSDFQTKVEMWSDGMEMQVTSIEVDRVENIYQYENRAKVKVVYEVEKMLKSVHVEKEMELVKENESWKMKKAYSPL